MLSFPMFALPEPRKAFTALRIASSFTSLTCSTSRSPVHAQQTPHLLSSDRKPAPTRHTRHAGAPATPSFSYASALFPSHRGCAPRKSTKNPLLFPSAFLTPLNATLTNPRATTGLKLIDTRRPAMTHQSRVTNFLEINTSKTRTKQTTLTTFRINTYVKPRGRAILEFACVRNGRVTSVTHISAEPHRLTYLY